MSAYRVALAAGVLVAALSPTSGLTQETRSPLPYIVAPPNTGEAPIVEQPPARLRSGPPRIACWACPSNTCGCVGYYLGGGFAFCRGQPRLPMEGTWGWDYRGHWIPQRILLLWTHGRCYQGGAGAYRVDGPNVLKWLEEKHQEKHAKP